MRLKTSIFIMMLNLVPLLSAAQEKLSLSDAISIGLDNNFGIQISSKNVEAAVESNSWGMAGALPSIDLYGSASTYRELIDKNDPLNTSVAYAQISVDWVLFSGFEIKANKALLENNEELAKGNETLIIENTIHSIINSYYYVLLQQEMVKVKKTIMDISLKRIEQNNTAREIGSGGTYESMLVQSAYLADESSYIQQEITFRDAVRSLNLLLSCDESTKWVLTEEITIPENSYSIDAMREKMLSDNRTLQNQYINLRSSEIEIKKERSARYPTIGVNAKMVGGDGTFLQSSGGAYLYPYVGLTLSFNLFNGGQTRRNINIATISSEMESLTTKELELTLNSELATQFDNFNVYKDVALLDTEQLQVAQTLLDLSEERYKSGSINYFNYREVQLSYLSSATSRLNSIYNLIATNTQLLRLTGGILSYK